ncbi:anti-sigma factor [Streptomyces durmitorensis]|uniref:Regulator of SigK n=1 Tax=Streptomyces durmitorensis TaxID=319947 RepID=A0ABY4PMN7_9ACTN|nr:anti-sigma factor [Streptomyces durmitorensis]UQT54559.1 anti-sigma factor [Streptomyces durmitorensis]
MSVTDPHTLAGAYALHALEPDERVTFEEHLALCAECRQDVAEFGATAGRLALAVSATPRQALKRIVLEEIAGVRQVPPRTVRRRVATSPRSARPRRFMLAACLAAAALGGVATWQHQEARQAREQAGRAQDSADQVAAVLTAVDARTHAASLPGGARGVVVTSASQNRAVFTASGLDTPPQGKVYELWFDEHGAMRPAGLLDSGRSDQMTLMDGTIGQATGMAVTVEPAGGSKTPTLPPVGLISFPA